MLKRIIIFASLYLIIPSLIGSVKAITYDLIAPQGQLRRGDQVQFSIYINTEGTTVTTGEIGMTYETQYLEYLNVIPGPAMDSVVATAQNTGSFLITGTNTAGFNGNDVFANLNFKLIADAPGSATLCALWAPLSPTQNPTRSPTNPLTPQPTNRLSSPSPTSSITEPTQQPANSTTPRLTPLLTPRLTAGKTKKNPTSLPKTGSTDPQDFMSIIGGFLLILTTAGFLVLKRGSL